MKKYLIWIVLLSASAVAQVGNPGVLYVVVAPSGACAAGSPIEEIVNGAGTVYACQNITAGVGTWTALASGGATGTVTSIGLAGTANEITVTGASPITGSGSWTLSLPSAVTMPGTLVVTGNLTTNMTGGPLCVHETNGVLSASGADCGTSGSSITVNGGSALTSPVNFQTGGAVDGLTIVASNPSGSNVQYALSGTYAGAVAATTLSASSTVSGTGFSTYLASPPSIGSTAPGSGAFTTLSATSTVNGAGFTALFASPPSIGNTTAGSGAFTTLSASSTVSGTGFSTYLASPPAIGGTVPAAGTFAGLTIPSGNVLNWNLDTGLSRTAAATLALGNGTQADTSGTLNLATLNASTGLNLGSGAATVVGIAAACCHKAR